MADPDGITPLLGALDAWSLTRLPGHNRRILEGRAAPEDLVQALNSELFGALPDPESLTPAAARRALVSLGLCGSSVGRHFQERDLHLKHTPEAPFQALAAGPRRTPFLEYFAQVARRSGTGHPPRDAFASLVRWNVPTIQVWWQGECLARLPGVFDGDEVRTYTGASGERAFFIFLKQAEAAELAANQLLAPLHDGTLPLWSREAVDRIRLATEMLAVVTRLNLDFATRPAETAITTDHFMDVFRQFAVHWRAGDVPPSGAQDAEYLKRDLILGIAFPDYTAAVLRQFPALLEEERQILGRLISRPSLTAMILDACGVSAEDVGAAGPDRLRALAALHPVLGAHHQLLGMNARVSASHLMLTKKFLFKPTRARDEAGVPDSDLVSHRAGTTGMIEQYLTTLAQARKSHPLARFSTIPERELARLCGLDPGLAVSAEALPEILRMAA